MRQYPTRGKVQLNAIAIGLPHWDVPVNRQSRSELGTRSSYPEIVGVQVGYKSLNTADATQIH